MEIKQVAQNQISDVIHLVHDVFMEFEAADYSQEGIKTFFDTALNNHDFIASLDIYGAFENNTLVGMIATKNEGAHISLFFVDRNHHRQGIGKKLFITVLESSPSNTITVNSSPYAKEIYHHLGFVDTDGEQTVTGIRFTPMIYKK